MSKQKSYSSETKASTIDSMTEMLQITPEWNVAALVFYSEEFTDLPQPMNAKFAKRFFLIGGIKQSKDPDFTIALSIVISFLTVK